MKIPKRINPIGSCFDSVGHNVLHSKSFVKDEMKICHGVVAVHYGGLTGHAWIEFRGDAYDCIYGTKTSIEGFRNQLRATEVVEYTYTQFLELWQKHNYPGPWVRTIARYVGDYENVRDRVFEDDEK